MNTIPAKQPLMSVEQPEQPAPSVSPMSPKLPPGRRKSDQKRSVSPMGERILRGSFDGNGF